MKEIAEYLINHCLQIFVLCCGFAIVLHAAANALKHPSKGFVELIEIIKIELGIGDYKQGVMIEDDLRWVLRMNMVIIFIFTLLTFITLGYELGPSMIKKIVGKDAGSASPFPIIFIICLILLVLSFIVSPSWVSRKQRELNTHRGARAALSPKSLHNKQIQNETS